MLPWEHLPLRQRTAAETRASGLAASGGSHAKTHVNTFCLRAAWQAPQISAQSPNALEFTDSVLFSLLSGHPTHTLHANMLVTCCRAWYDIMRGYRDALLHVLPAAATPTAHVAMTKIRSTALAALT